MAPGKKIVPLPKNGLHARATFIVEATGLSNRSRRYQQGVVSERGELGCSKRSLHTGGEGRIDNSAIVHRFTQAKNRR